jgi:hypothetical protein
VILGGGHSDEARALERAEGILTEHEDAGEIVGVPAPAWAECCHCDFDTSFVIWPLNPKAAVIANRLTPAMIQAGKAKGCTRRAAKLDALILATAEAKGCTAIYTTDGWFDEVAKAAGLTIQVRSLPPVRPVQVPIPAVSQVDIDAQKPTDSKIKS